MTVSKAQQRATAKYVKKNYDRIEIKVPAGQKAVIQSHADNMNEKSINSFVIRAIAETMERDNAAK